MSRETCYGDLSAAFARVEHELASILFDDPAVDAVNLNGNKVDVGWRASKGAMRLMVQTADGPWVLAAAARLSVRLPLALCIEEVVEALLDAQDRRLDDVASAAAALHSYADGIGAPR